MFAKANNDQKFMFIGGIATKYYFLSFLGITVQEKPIAQSRYLPF